ncbi:HAMP domain-containing sensor histidine kinase [Pontibacter sp. G13]|uniref:HAMP domain-containing sensor histidine kinase n=1 Tax=Pontibacter sp. G13 TaxID=3074898 RepID=UPI00288B8C0D|nr:HAMP domain-containing sensor histidine kinase [Pontibacter sp. G13]WNJ17527.1 HAMP domain-containing sensor histidine kinase [Pontibacter sp. G13]
MSNRAVSTRLISKIMISFLLLLVLVGICQVGITYYLTSNYFEETTQKLNAQVAQHLIEEKFQDKSPFLEDGAVNKPLFGDIMHDMMAVNRGIEVYLVDQAGMILYSVVLDHSDSEAPATQIDLAPVKEFIQQEGSRYVLGDDPRNPEEHKIFSAAPFEVDGKEGYIYIILASQRFEQVTSSLFGSYFLKVGSAAGLATLIFAGLLGIWVIWLLTGNLREIINTVKRFREGDMEARIPDANQNDLAALAVSFNEMADTIVENIEALKSVESLRRELIANVSHDLRTPLAIMQGYVETLQMKRDSITAQDRDKYLDIVQNSTEKLSKLVQQLFEYSKLEARQIEPHKEPFPISDLAHDVHESYQQLAQAKEIDIQLEIEEGLPWVFADVSLVERVIQNLMDNALKFTPAHGTVVIQLTSDTQRVHVAIKDTGPGIPEADQAHIFERFKRAEPKVQQGGAGLGLAIAKKIMEIHDSTIQVVSMPDHGTTFEFQLPSYAA